jgi:hypothetical protein
MPAVDACVVRQSAQLKQRLPHHFRRTLDDAPAADREQSVADKGQLVGRKEIANVTGGVSRRLEHAASQRADLNLIIFSHGRVHQWNARGLSVRGNNPTIVALLEFGNTASVIRVMMGDENIAEPPPGCF